MQTTPWIVEAGEYYAIIASQFDDECQITRMSAECKWGMAKDALAKATATVAFLNACYEMEAAH